MARRFAIFYSTIFLFVASDAFAEAMLDAKESISAGAEIKIGVTGSTSKKDFVTIVSPDTEEGQYQRYQYPRSKGAVTLAAPEDPGAYEIRLLSGESGYSTIVKRPLKVTEVTGSITVEAEVAAGAEMKISWTGPANKKDFITVVEKDADEGTYTEYKYLRNAKGKPVKLRAPEFAGEYEIRYVTGEKRYTLASANITVTAVTAELSAPENVKAGAAFQVEWKGPDNKADFVTIVEKGSDEGTWGNSYKYVKNKLGPRKLQRVKLKAPDFAGDYEVRYVTGKKKLTLASADITVTATEASLDAQAEVMEGASFEVSWEGPDNKGDYISIVPEGTEEGKSGSSFKYVYRKMGPRKLKKVKLIAPEESGNFELRYITGGKKLTLASKMITVTPASASIKAPKEAPVRDVVGVSWEGPGNNGDYIALVRADSESNELKNFAYVRRGKDLRIKTPKEPGTYEVRYVTAKKKKVLAREMIEITPSKVPGTLKVVASSSETGASSSTKDMSVALILDASGSMLKRDSGKRRIEIAKKAVNELLAGPLSEGTPFALRVFGHKEADSCRTDLEIPLAPLKKRQATSKVNGINAKNLAKTPIAKSLELVKSDLESAEGKRVVILVTDGEETCEGNPEEAIKQLAASGFDTRVNIVGFAIDEYMLKETFQDWARLGNGKYFDASNAEELEQSIKEAIEVPYQVLNSEDKVVASGVVNGEAISVLPGNYKIKLLSSSEGTMKEVVIEAEKRALVNITG